MNEKRTIPLSVPWIQGHEWIYVKECLDTGWVSSAGSFINRFEKELSAWVGAPQAVATVNGTAALHLALLAVGVKENDEVLLPDLSFIATANAIRYCGARPVFIDCDNTYNLDVDKLQDFLQHNTQKTKGSLRNKRSGRRISAILPAHLFGVPADMEPIMELADAFDLKVVEDAAESLGSRYKNSFVGTIGHCGIFSFNGNKIITTGGGGMVVTKDETLARRIKHLSTQAKINSQTYIHDEVGFNYRLTNVQAAIGVAQLEKLSEIIEKKKQNYFRYKEGMENIPGLTLAQIPDYANPNYWFYCMQIGAEYPLSRDELQALLQEKGIQTRPAWYPLHWQKPYLNCETFAVEKSVELWEKTLNIPCSPSLTEEDIQYILEVLKF